MSTRLMTPPPGGPAEYMALSPQGKFLPISKELFEALELMRENRRAGQIITHTRNGGIAGVDVSFKMK